MHLRTKELFSAIMASLVGSGFIILLSLSPQFSLDQQARNSTLVQEHLLTEGKVKARSPRNIQPAETS